MQYAVVTWSSCQLPVLWPLLMACSAGGRGVTAGTHWHHMCILHMHSSCVLTAVRPCQSAQRLALRCNRQHPVQMQQQTSPPQPCITCRAFDSSCCTCACWCYRCLLSKVYNAAAPLLDLELTEVDPGRTAVGATDLLLYCYYGGMVAAGAQAAAHH